MAIYYQPPGPHVGGRQPYDNKDLPPSVEAVQVDAPPVAAKSLPFHLAWWDVYVPRQLSQSSPGVFSTVSNPPFGRQPQQPLAWQTPYALPQLTEKLPPSLLDVPVNDPPFARRLPAFHSAWWETYSPQHVYESSPGVFATVQIDNPPFGGRQPQVAWPATPPPPQLTEKLPPSLLDVPANNPPFGKRFQPFYSAHWDPPPSPMQRADLDASAGIPGQSVDNPPAARSTAPPTAWWLVDPAPTQLRRLAPGVPGQSVDNPPGIGAAVPQGPAPAPAFEPFYDVQRRYLVQPFVTQSADSAPFSSVWQTIIRSWQYDPGAPRLPKLLPASLVAVPEDSPVPQHRGRTPASQQITAWFSSVLPYRPGFFGSQTAAPPGWSVDPPPQFRIFVAPPQPLVPPQQFPGAKLTTSGAAPVADQFPTASTPLALRWWVAQALPPVLPRLLPLGTPGLSIDPPPGFAPAQPGATHWEQRRLIVVSSQLSPGVPGQSVDVPPPLAARQQSWRDGLHPVTQLRPGVPSSAAVDFPPASSLDSGWSVAHWFAPYVAPQRSRPLSSSLLAVRVDDPPFDARRLGRLASVVDRAQIPLPDRVYLRYVVQQGPALTLGTIVCGSIVVLPMFEAELTALPAQSASPASGPALDGDPSLDECD